MSYLQAEATAMRESRRLHLPESTDGLPSSIIEKIEQYGSRLSELAEARAEQQRLVTAVDDARRHDNGALVKAIREGTQPPKPPTKEDRARAKLEAHGRHVDALGQIIDADDLALRRAITEALPAIEQEVGRRSADVDAEAKQALDHLREVLLLRAHGRQAQAWARTVATGVRSKAPQPEYVVDAAVSAVVRHLRE